MTGPIIIGGGPAGSAVALALAAAGARPVVLERAHTTGDAICGGFLSWQTLDAMARLGVPADVLGGQPVSRVRIFAGARVVEAALPQAGMGLSRRRMDSMLIAAAASAGAGIERGVTVRGAAAGRVDTGDGAALASNAIFLACGKHALPGHPRRAPAATRADPVVGLRTRLAAGPRIASLVDDAVELFLFDRGYAGLVRQEDGTANLCLAVHKSRLTEAGGRPEGLIAAWGKENPRLGERLAAGGGGTDGNAGGSIDAIAAVPYGWQADADAAAPGLWRLGDQAAVIPSLAGEGMGIALATAASAAAAWIDGAAAPDWQQAMARRLARPMRIAGLAWRLAERPGANAAGVAMLRVAPGLVGLIGRLTRA